MAVKAKPGRKASRSPAVATIPKRTRRLDPKRPTIGMVRTPVNSKEYEDRYTAKLLKYIPAEVLALFIPLVALADKLKAHHDVIMWFTIGIGVVCTVGYNRWQATDVLKRQIETAHGPDTKDPWSKTLIQAEHKRMRPRWFFYPLSVVAFGAWILATAGSVRTLVHAAPAFAEYVLAAITLTLPLLDVSLAHLTDNGFAATRRLAAQAKKVRGDRQHAKRLKAEPDVWAHVVRASEEAAKAQSELLRATEEAARARSAAAGVRREAEKINTCAETAVVAAARAAKAEADAREDVIGAEAAAASANRDAEEADRGMRNAIMRANEARVAAHKASADAAAVRAAQSARADADKKIAITRCAQAKDVAAVAANDVAAANTLLQQAGSAAHAVNEVAEAARADAAEAEERARTAEARAEEAASQVRLLQAKAAEAAAKARAEEAAARNKAGGRKNARTHQLRRQRANRTRRNRGAQPKSTFAKIAGRPGDSRGQLHAGRRGDADF